MRVFPIGFGDELLYFLLKKEGESIYKKITFIFSRLSFLFYNFIPTFMSTTKQVIF